MSACIALRDIVPREVVFALGLMVVELIAQILQVWCCAEECEAVLQHAVDLQNHALACKKEARQWNSLLLQLEVWCCAEACEAVHQYAVDLQNHALACKKEARLIEDCVDNIHKTRKACEDMLSVTGNALVMMDHAEVRYTRRQ